MAFDVAYLEGDFAKPYPYGGLTKRTGVVDGRVDSIGLDELAERFALPEKVLEKLMVTKFG